MLTNYNREVQYTVNKITMSHICITYNHITSHTLTPSKPNVWGSIHRLPCGIRSGIVTLHPAPHLSALLGHIQTEQTC